MLAEMELLATWRMGDSKHEPISLTVGHQPFYSWIPLIKRVVFFLQFSHLRTYLEKDRISTLSVWDPFGTRLGTRTARR